MTDDAEAMEAFFKEPTPVYVRVFDREGFFKFLHFIHDDPPKGRLDVQAPDRLGYKVNLIWNIPS